MEDFEYVPTPVEDIEAGDSLEVDTGHGLQQFRVEKVERIHPDGAPAKVTIESVIIESMVAA